MFGGKMSSSFCASLAAYDISIKNSLHLNMMDDESFNIMLTIKFVSF